MGAVVVLLAVGACAGKSSSGVIQTTLKKNPDVMELPQWQSMGATLTYFHSYDTGAKSTRLRYLVTAEKLLSDGTFYYWGTYGSKTTEYLSSGQERSYHYSPIAYTGVGEFRLAGESEACENSDGSICVLTTLTRDYAPFRVVGPAMGISQIEVHNGGDCEPAPAGVTVEWSNGTNTSVCHVARSTP